MLMRLTYAAVMLAGFVISGCAHPLEQVVDEHHQARMDAANANRPLARGAADGLGAYIAQSAVEERKIAQP
jgi:hypothetical protein